MKKLRQGIALMLAFMLLVTGLMVNPVQQSMAATKAKKITLNVTKKTMEVDSTYTLKVKTVTPKKASKAVTWKTSNKKVATVKSNGKVTAKGEGKATITAVSKSNKKVKASCKITVVAAEKVTPTEAPAETPAETKSPVPTQAVATQTPVETKAPVTTESPVKVPSDEGTATETPVATTAPTEPVSDLTNGMPTIGVGMTVQTPVTGIKCYNVHSISGKGDASVINCGNKQYVMIDCGTADDADHLLERLEATCQKQSDGKIHFKALVISHNHKDHMGGIKKLLSSDIISVDTVYYTYIGPKDNIKTVVDAASKHGAEVVKLISNAQYKNNVEGEYRKDLTINGTKITILGPAKKFADHETDEMDCNNSSMVVKVEGSIRALFLGDLVYDGLKAVEDTYSSVLFKQGEYYDFCKYGHHGLRNGSATDADSNFNQEIKIYNENIRAKQYVFTTSNDYMKGLGKNYLSNYQYLQKKLKYFEDGVTKEDEKNNSKISLSYATCGTW